jgi:hypothetical protein
MKTLLVPLVLFCGCSAQSAYACTIEPPPLMTTEEKAAEQARIKQEFIDRAKSAPVILHVEAVTSSGENESHALFDVRHVYKGKARKGRVIKLRTIGSSLCGAGGVKRRQRGIIILSASEPRLFNGFLWSGDIEILQKEGILPVKLPK